MEKTWSWVLAILVLGLVIVPQYAFAQTVDPTTAVTAMETWITGPFAKILIAFLLAVVGIACVIGHHPFAAVGVVCLGAFLIFGSQFFVTQFFGG
jgi:type IV secretory pathway VirB2 component (pilin)